jgi:hypothetical protein
VKASDRDAVLATTTAAERRRVGASVRATFAIARLNAAATALIELRELTDPGPHADWLDKQIGSVLGAREVLEQRRSAR